jgi:hypothetical protein
MTFLVAFLSFTPFVTTPNRTKGLMPVPSKWRALALKAHVAVEGVIRDVAWEKYRRKHKCCKHGRSNHKSIEHRWLVTSASWRCVMSLQTAWISAGSFVPFTKVSECSTSSVMQHKSNGADAAEQAEPSDLNRAPVDDLEEMSFDRPEYLPVERFRPGIRDFLLNLLLIAGLLALGGLYLLSLIS